MGTQRSALYPLALATCSYSRRKMAQKLRRKISATVMQTWRISRNTGPCHGVSDPKTHQRNGAKPSMDHENAMKGAPKSRRKPMKDHLRKRSLPSRVMGRRVNVQVHRRRRSPSTAKQYTRLEKCPRHVVGARKQGILGFFSGVSLSKSQFKAFITHHRTF